MNGINSARWSSQLQFLATEGLNSCTAVAVISEWGGILAHVGPGDDNVRNLMQEVVKQYRVGEQHGLFPPAAGVVIAAVYRERLALRDAVTTMRKILEKLGLSVRYEEYRVREQGEARPTGQYSLIIHGRSGLKPQVYFDDKLLTDEGAELDRQLSRPDEETTDAQGQEASAIRWLQSVYEPRYGEHALSQVKIQIRHFMDSRDLSRGEAITQLVKSVRAQQAAASSSASGSAAPGPSVGRTSGSSASATVQRDSGSATEQPGLSDRGRAIKARFHQMEEKALGHGLQWPAKITDSGFEQLAEDEEKLKATLAQIQEHLRRQGNARPQLESSSEEDEEE